MRSHVDAVRVPSHPGSSIYLPSCPPGMGASLSCAALPGLGNGVGAVTPTQAGW